MVGAFWIIGLVAAGFGLYGYGLLVVAMRADLGWSAAETTFGYTILVLVSGLVGPPMAWVVDRIGGRRTVLGSVMLFGVGLFVMASATTHVVLYGAALLLGTGFCGMTALVAGMVVSRWFTIRRGLAIGISTSGFALGGTAIPPVLSLALSAIGWRAALVVSGAICFVVLVPLVWFFIRDKPEEFGLQPDGRPAGRATAAHSGEALAPLTLIALLRSHGFWLLTAGFFLSYLAINLAILSSAPHFHDRGEDYVAPLALSIVSLTSFVWRLGAGALADRIEPKLFTSGVILVEAIGIALFGLPVGLPIMIFGLVLVGIALGAITPLNIIMIGKYYGANEVGRIGGWVGFFAVVGAAVGPVIGGFIRDTFGNYAPSMILGCAMCLAGSLSISLLRPPRALTGAG